MPRGGMIVSSSPLSSPITAVRYTSRKDDISADEMKRDIEQMKQEAIQRLEALTEKLHGAEEELQAKQAEAASRKQQEPKETLAVVAPEPTTRPPSKDAFADNPFMDEEELLEQRMKRDRLVNESPSSSSSSSSAAAAAANQKIIGLLDNSRWRLMLNIGREPGTWMPKTWGVSGERLLMNLEMEFTSQQSYDSEEFLNGMDGAKVLHIVHNEANIAPSMKEGGRSVRVSDGAWRVAPKEGPMGTSVMRFYLELEEEALHQGSDVYCPVGRIYCTCGYFPMEGRTKMNELGEIGGSMKDSLRKKIHELEAQYENLQTENDNDKNLMSWEMMKRGKQMMDLRMQAGKLNQQMYEAQVQEPDKSFLRLSQDQTVGLTREGGVCCKVNKGLAIEYHILGKFEIASMSNREHSDYRELLP